MAESPQGPQPVASGTSSFRHLAELIGVSEKAVRKAETAGVFSEGSVRRTGGRPVVVDVNLAMVEWIRSGRQFRGPAARTMGVSRPSGGTEVVPPPEPTPASLAAPAVVDPGGGGDDFGDLPAAGAMSLVEAQRMAMIERGRKLRLENDQREGLLLDVDRASTEAFEFARVLRETVLNIPARIAAELAAEPDAGRVHIRLDLALREALEATAARLECGGGETVHTSAQTEAVCL